MPLRFLIIFGLLGIAEYYSFIVVRSALRGLPSAWRTGIFVFYLVLTIISWLGILLFRQINWAALPHLLRNIYIAFVLGFMVGKLLILIIMLLDEVRRGIMYIVNLIFPYQPKPRSLTGMTRSQFFSSVALIVGATSVISFLYGIANRYKYVVRRVKIKLPGMPEAFKGMKIVQLSDIHTGSFDNHAAVAKGIETALAQNGDIIFFTGDLVNNHAEEVDAKYQEIFSKLKAPLGVYSTLGNHDYGDYMQWPTPEAKKANLDRLKSIHAEMGWKLMMNEHVILERGNDKIAIIGIENWSAKANFTRYGDMKKAYEGLAEKNVPIKILLSHDPSHWDAQVRPSYTDVQLTLSGHTHGMQFGIDIPGLKWSPVKYVYPKWAGLYQIDNQYLYVNRGFGFLGYPGRLGILPEITVIELV